MTLLVVEENVDPFTLWNGQEAALKKTISGDRLLATPQHVSEDGDEKSDEKRDEVLEGIYETLPHLALALVIMHIAGVVLASVVQKENLTGPRSSAASSRSK